MSVWRSEVSSLRTWPSIAEGAREILLLRRMGSEPRGARDPGGLAAGSFAASSAAPGL